MIYLLVPIVVITKVYAKELYTFFYQTENLFYILSDVALFIFFIGFYKVIIGISQGMKKFNYIVISTFISAIAKVVLNIILVPYYSYMGAVIATIIAISICLMVSYYVLYQAKLNLFFSNLKSLFFSLLSLFISMVIATIFRITFFMNYTFILEILMFCGVIFIFYLLVLSFCNLFKVSKAKAAS